MIIKNGGLQMKLQKSVVILYSSHNYSTIGIILNLQPNPRPHHEIRDPYLCVFWQQLWDISWLTPDSLTI
jgi:hypothetical protein